LTTVIVEGISSEEWMEAFIPHKKGCLLDCLDWIPNRDACIDVCLSCDVTRSFRLHDIKALRPNLGWLWRHSNRASLL